MAGMSEKISRQKQAKPSLKYPPQNEFIHMD
jgi:hypothetical protein